MYVAENMTQEEMHNVFLDHLNELQKIRSLEIPVKHLPAVALLFETGKLEELEIYSKFEGEWPSFLEDCHTLTSIKFTGQKVLAEAPSWIRNTASLRSLCFRETNITFLPDWISELKSLTELTLDWNNNLLTLPDCIGDLKGLVTLNICRSAIEKLPDSIGNLESLTTLTLDNNENLKTLPDSIGNLKNLNKLDLKYLPIKNLPDSIGNLKNLQEFIISDSSLEKLPDSIGDLQSLIKLSLSYNKNLEQLPDSIGNLSTLAKLYLCQMPIKKLPDSIGNLKNLDGLSLGRLPLGRLPDCIGDLRSLTGLSLYSNWNMEALPDSIGNLKNLLSLYLSGSPVEKLPDTIVNCTALEFVDISETHIYSVPEFISSVKTFKDNLSTELIPEGHSISYRCFCNCYYRLVGIILNFSEKARNEGVLALEEELEDLSGEFIKKGLRLTVDGTDSDLNRRLMLTELEQEHNFYRKKLMKVAMEGVLGIQAGYSKLYFVFILAHLVDIINNPLEAVCEKYLAGDFDAFSGIDLKAAIQPEEEREEVRFAKRAYTLNEIQRKEGLLALEKHLDQNGIAALDVFEYGLQFVIDDWDFSIIEKILDGLIEREADPVRRNFAMAKKEAVRSIQNGDNPRVLIMNLCAFFDEDTNRDIFNLLDD